jgi:hypothetical protein
MEKILRKRFLTVQVANLPVSGILLRQKALVVVEVLGFGAVCICRSMLTFQRNMLSPSSGTEVARQRNTGVYKGPEDQGLGADSQSEGGNMDTGCGPIGSLQEGYGEGGGCGVREKEREREKSPSFQGSPEGVVFLLGAGLCSLRSQMTGFHDLLKEKH